MCDAYCIGMKAFVSWQSTKNGNHHKQLKCQLKSCEFFNESETIIGKREMHQLGISWISMFFLTPLMQRREDTSISQVWIWADSWERDPHFFYSYVFQLNIFDIEIIKKINPILVFHEIIFQGSRRGSTLNFCSNIIQMGQVQIMF